MVFLTCAILDIIVFFFNDDPKMNPKAKRGICYVLYCNRNGIILVLISFI